jgi:hypothetical protein
MNIKQGINLLTVELGALVVITVALSLTTEATAAVNKLDVCHVTNVPAQGDGHIISIADPGLPAHEEHGDKQLKELGVMFDMGAAICHVSTGPVAPVAVDDEVTTPVDTPVTIDVLANDIYDDPLIVSIQEFPQNGILGILEVGMFEYTPNAGFVGTDSFTYKITDNAGLFDTATVTINVGP